MKENELQVAFAQWEQAVTDIVGEPWGEIYWRTIMSTEPIHYFYYRPARSPHLVYWTDIPYRTGVAEMDVWIRMERANQAAKSVWRAWTAAHSGLSPWTSATWYIRRGEAVREGYGYQHRHQVDPTEEQFAWEVAVWGEVYTPYRIAVRRTRAYGQWHAPRAARRRPHAWRRMPRGYLEWQAPGVYLYRGARRLVLRAPAMSEHEVSTCDVDVATTV